jgi:hypothetical protein
MRLLQKSREAAYLLDPSKFRPETLYRPSTQPSAQPGDLEPFLCRATPAERSLTDKYDNPNVPAADLFSRPDTASNVLPADTELLIAAQEALIPPELLDSVIHLRTTRAARMTCTVPPQRRGHLLYGLRGVTDSANKTSRKCSADMFP